MLIFDKQITKTLYVYPYATPHGWLTWIATNQGEEYHSGGATWMFGFDGELRKFSDFNFERNSYRVDDHFKTCLAFVNEDRQTEFFYSKNGKNTNKLEQALKVSELRDPYFAQVIEAPKLDQHNRLVTRGEKEFLLGLAHNIEQDSSAVILCNRETQQTAILSPIIGIKYARVAQDNMTVFIIGENQVAIVDNPLVNT